MDHRDSFHKYQTSEVTNKILLLLRNPEQMKNMGKAARNKVVSNYSSNRTYDQLVVILNKLCR